MLEFLPVHGSRITYVALKCNVEKWLEHLGDHKK